MSNNATSVIESPLVHASSLSFVSVPQSLDYSVQVTHQSAQEGSFSRWTHTVVEKISDFHAHYVAPITKPQVDKFIVDSISFSAYSSLTGGIKIPDVPLFVVRAELSMGYKVFTAVANPFIAQFVESFTQVHLDNAKYVYYKSQCVINGKYCEDVAGLKNHFGNEYNEQSNAPLIQDLTQFDLKGYLNQASSGLDGIKVSNLLSGGFFSASASQVRDFIFDVTGLTPHMQGYWSKNWVSYYFKEWIKGELKSEADVIKNNLQNKLGLNELPITKTPDPTSKPLAINDIISTEHGDIITTTSTSVAPLLDTTHLLMPLQAMAPVETLA